MHAQVLGASGRSAEDYQSQTVATRGSTAYGAAQDSRATIGSGASYVVGGAPSVNASGVYGASDVTKYAEVSKYADQVAKYGDAPKYGEVAKYGDNAKYTGSASTAGYGGKASEYGVANSPTDYNQKTSADQYGSSYNMKAADYGMSERSHFGQAQSAYGQADSRSDAARGYQDPHAVTPAAQQRQVRLKSVTSDSSRCAFCELCTAVCPRTAKFLLDLTVVKEPLFCVGWTKSVSLNSDLLQFHLD